MLATYTLKHTLLLVGLTVHCSAITPKDESTTTDIDICTIPQFQWHLNSAGPYCCPGILDQEHGDASKAYCCVGVHAPDNAVWTTTQTSCATKISVYPQAGYSNNIREAATRYGATYTTDVGVGSEVVVETTTVGGTAMGSRNVGGAAAARATGAVGLGGGLLVVGGLLLGA